MFLFFSALFVIVAKYSLFLLFSSLLTFVATYSLPGALMYLARDWGFDYDVLEKKIFVEGTDRKFAFNSVKKMYARYDSIPFKLFDYISHKSLFEIDIVHVKIWRTSIRSR